MKSLCEKYAAKLVAQGLADHEAPIVGGIDAELVWNRHDERIAELSHLFDTMSINSLVFARPAEPYATIVEFLTTRYNEKIRPEDTETRTFLHDIPICQEFSAAAISHALGQRKAVIIPGHGIASYGTVSPEQGFVFYSSTIFACTVLFFSDYLKAARAGDIDEDFRTAFNYAADHFPTPPATPPALALAPLNNEESVLSAMAEAGRAVVDYGLVDSFFGNLSYRLNDTIYISQTGSSLDELEGCIDPCPMGGGSTAGLTASSELTAHEDVFRRSDDLCILHGHPKFSVIMSMDCAQEDCPHRGACHVKCDQCRTVEGIPIVPGEVGTGPTGLCNTLPPAVATSGAAIVHGHGAFTTGASDFNEAFHRLLQTENRCRKQYFERIASLTSSHSGE